MNEHQRWTVEFDLAAYDHDRPLEVGTVYGHMILLPPPQGAVYVSYEFDGERLVWTNDPPTEPLPKAGEDMLREEREARQAIEDAARADAREREAIRESAERLGLIPEVVECQPTVEAFEGTSIFWPASTVISGEEGDGKSALALEVAFALATGTPLLGMFENAIEPMRVLLIQTENSDTEMRRRRDALNARAGFDADPANLYVFSKAKATTLDFSLPQHRDRFQPSESRLLIEEAVEKIGLGCIVLDPIYALIGAADVSDRNMQMPGVLRWLDSLEAMGCPVAFTHRGSPTQPLELFGSKFIRHHVHCGVSIDRRAVTGHLWADFAIRVEPKRQRDTYPATKFVVRGKGVGTWEEPPPKISPATESSEDERPAPDHDEALDIVRESLRTDPDLTVRQREEKTGISKSRLSRLINIVQAAEAS